MSGSFTPPITPTASTPQAPAAKGFDILDLKQYFHVIVKRIWLVALCFVVSLSVTVVMLVRQVPVYRSSATLLLSKGLPLPKQVKQEEMEGIMGDYMETQLRIMQSPAVISRARERVNRPSEEIARKLVRVWPEQAWRTAFIYIRCESLDPVFAADFANALAEEYLDFKAEERMDASQSTVISLTQQANRLREELRRAEERVLGFEKENSVVAIEARGNVAARNLANLSSEAAQLKTDRMLLEYQQPLLDKASDDIVLTTLLSPFSPMATLSQPPIASAPGTNASGIVTGGRGAESLLDREVMTSQGDWQSLKREKSRLEARLANLRVKFRDAHPEIQKTLADIKELETRLDIEVQFALRQYYSKLESLALREQAMRRAELEWEDLALAATRKEHEYRDLKTDVQRLSSLYDLLFNRLKEIDVSIGIEPESIRIMEKAVPSYGPVTPRRMQSIFLAAIIGLAIGIGLVFGLEYIDDSIRYPEEVTKNLGLNFLGVIPAANWDPDDLRTHLLTNIDQKSGLAEAYRNVRSALLFSAADETVKTICMTSAVPKEGKTTTSLNLAASLAQANARVLLVDADLRRGEVHKFFGLEAGRGLSDVLAGHAKPEAVVQRTGIPNLDVVATGPFPPNPAELMLRAEFNAFVEFARRNYDRIVFDAPPIMAVSESGILASLVDGVVLVVWAGQTSRKLCQMSLQIMRQRGANLLGCVLNNLEFGRVGYYYYSTYYGYYDYDYRYERADVQRRT